VLFSAYSLCVCVCVCVCVCARVCVVGIELRASYMLGEHSPTELHPQPLNLLVCLFIHFLFFQTESRYEPQAGLRLMIFLSQPPQYWNYRHAPQCLAPQICFDMGQSD
jgi:hypothetical protein